MDFDLSWLLLALPAAFALGWMTSRLDLRQANREHRDAPRAYFKGLSLLLNEQQDKAIDVFIEAIQNDPDTVDLHFALGSLFRRRGEFQRAIRVHEHLLSRQDLPPLERQRARHALAQDFLRAGLFDRAEASFLELEGTDFQGQARLALLSLQERAREWDRAIEVAASLQASGAGSFANRIGHYHCERATDLHNQGQENAAAQRLQAAHKAAPELPRPWVTSGQWALQRGDTAQAMSQWESLLERHPMAFDLVALDYAKAARLQGCDEKALGMLETAFRRHPSLALLKATTWLESTGHAPDEREGEAEPMSPKALARLADSLHQMPSLSASAMLLGQPAERWGAQGLQALRQAVERAARPVQRYRCAGCGFEAQRYFWQCPGCLGWDTFPPRTIEEL